METNFTRSIEHEPATRLFHVSGYGELKDKEKGDSFVLNPGPQGAEGKGVYFAENDPRFTAAEGAKDGASAVVVIGADSKDGWWRSKGFVAKKFGRPRTWHSEGKDVRCTIKNVQEIDGLKYLFCDWEWE